MLISVQRKIIETKTKTFSVFGYSTDVWRTTHSICGSVCVCEFVRVCVCVCLQVLVIID